MGILLFHYHLNRSDKSININKIDSIYRILLYSSTFMFYRTIYTAPMAIPTTQPQQRYRHSRPAYANPLFIKSLPICSHRILIPLNAKDFIILQSYSQIFIRINSFPPKIDACKNRHIWVKMTQMTQLNHAKSLLHPFTLTHSLLRALHIILYNI